MPLAGVTDPEHVVAEIATSLGVAATPHADVQAALADHFRGDSVLLVLDNFEHVLAAAPALSELLDQG